MSDTPRASRTRRPSSEPTQYTVDVTELLKLLLEGQNSLRESQHAAANSANNIGLRTERIEGDLRELKTVQASHAAWLQRAEGAFGTIKLLGGASVLSTIGMLAALGKAFGWW
jgi:hypothetical protein